MFHALAKKFKELVYPKLPHEPGGNKLNERKCNTPNLYEGTSENGFNLVMKVMQLDCYTESQFNDFCPLLDFDLLSSEE